MSARTWERFAQVLVGIAFVFPLVYMIEVSLHAEGRALDWMISAGSPANRRTVARFIKLVSANNWKLGRAMGLQEVIWNRKIWTATYHASGFRSYTGPNPHTDHVHIGLNRAGASKRTSFWR